MPDSAASRDGRSTPPPHASSTSTPSTPPTVKRVGEPLSLTTPPQPARLRGFRGSLGAEKIGTSRNQDNIGATPLPLHAPQLEIARKASDSKAPDIRDEEELDDFGLAVNKKIKAKPAERSKSESRETEENDGSDDEFESADEGESSDVKPTVVEGSSKAEEKTKDKLVVQPSKDHKEPPVDVKAEPGKPDGDKKSAEERHQRSQSDALAQIIEAGPDHAIGGISEWSHQALAPKEIQKVEEEEDVWQQMPAYGKYDLYDDDGRLVARGTQDSDEDDDGYEGGARKGYTRVGIEEDARSATSMDENTSYLFKEKGTNVQDEFEEARDPLAQMQATKDLLTEGQRIAYVGVVRLSMVKMTKTLEGIQATKAVKKDFSNAVESMKMWSQKMMVRLYAHMEIDSSEQIMIEQLAEHGVQPADLTPALMVNSRVKNPMADEDEPSPDVRSEHPSRTTSFSAESTASDAPPAYELHKDDELPEVRNPEDLPSTKSIDIDLRWTVLCDLFLVLIADSIYDSRSRVLLETVGEALEIKWIDICRFEKRVTDALEMQEQANRENWDEAEHMESRRKLALKRRYMIMGLATVGGSLVIGLSAGLLAPVIGAGLAAGFTTIGVAGTSGFLAGAGGIAIITTGSAISGGVIGVRASGRRMGAVKTFEYRPLHNNKRVNLIVTVSGWMNGKVDDVRLPFSTVDPIMGDIYSILWEPDMLQSTGETVRILATEALTQGLQQVLASTILTALMASLSLPIVLSKLSYLLDNPWSVSLDRADSAGLILADSLIDRNLGVRPITLVGFSLGSRLIFSCLREMAKKGAYGLIQNVYLFGSPIVAKKDEYLRARSVVSGRFVNAYATNDWIIGYLFRATSGGISRVAGLAAVEDIPGLENFDVTALVPGHMAYRAAMPRLLREVGWEVESDEFAEIEDPDPENHGARQRELIREIEDARKEADDGKNKKKGGLGAFFRRGVKPKKGWETYDEAADDGSGAGKEGKDTYNPVLFDIDAIRAELESEQLEVRQLESTLPPMRLDLNATSPSMNGGSNSPSATAAASGSNAVGSGSASPANKVAPADRLQDGTTDSPRPTYDHWDDYDAHHAKDISLGQDKNISMSSEPSLQPPRTARAASPATDFPSTTRRLGGGGSSSEGVSRTASPLSAAISPTVGSSSENRLGAEEAQNGGNAYEEVRPETTSPLGFVPVGSAYDNGMDLGHNAWADEDEFGQRKGGTGGEMSMTFE